VVAAGLLAACRATGVKLEDQRVLLVGAGAAGVGIARQIRHLVKAAGAGEDPSAHLALFDTEGLVVDDRSGLDAHKTEFAWGAATAQGVTGDARRNLAGFIDVFRPTVLVGTTGQPRVFDEAVIRTMARHADRPVVLALSNPTSKTEGIPAEIAAWTEGRALIATGSPFDPIALGGRSIPVSQCNNVYVFPGVGLGAIVSGARQVTDSMFAAAAGCLAGQVSEFDLERGALYPPLADLRTISRKIASAVAREARDCGAAPERTDEELERALEHEIWDLEYPRLQPV
jgi:malic enzyme